MPPSFGEAARVKSAVSVKAYAILAASQTARFKKQVVRKCQDFYQALYCIGILKLKQFPVCGRSRLAPAFLLCAWWELFWSLDNRSIPRQREKSDVTKWL